MGVSPNQVWYTPQYIAVTKSGDLVYTDGSDRTVNVNIVKNTQMQTVARLEGQRSRGVSNTSFGDYVNAMESDND